MATTNNTNASVTDAVIGSLAGGVVGAVVGLFSDKAHHAEKVQGHMSAYQHIAAAAAQGSLKAMQKLLWGKGAPPAGDYDEIKGMITSAWNQIAQMNPTLAAQAIRAGGLSNTAYPLDQASQEAQSYNSGSSISNDSIAGGNVVGQYRTGVNGDGSLAGVGAVANPLTAAIASVEGGGGTMWFVIAVCVGLGAYALRKEF